jgi:FlaA1/EpsC-like NDP-sugar epimerase
MKRHFFKLISQSRLMQQFRKAPSPQWMVFAVDIIIVIAASVLTLNFNPDPTYDLTGWAYAIPSKVTIVAIVYVLAMLLVKPYRSIIRLSAFEDTYRIIMTILTASVFGVIVEIVQSSYSNTHFIGFWSIFVLGVISFSMLMLIRLVIKYVYRNMEDPLKRRPTVILGSGYNSFALAASLAAESNGSYEPVLLLSLDGKNSGSLINGIPIVAYSKENIGNIFKSYKSDTLLFLHDQIEFMRTEGADVFLHNNIKLLMLNRIEEFDAADKQRANVSTHVQNIKIEDLLSRDPIVNNNPRIAETTRDKTVLITGAAGSIGSEIVRQIASYNPGRIILVDQAETPMHELQLELDRNFPGVSKVMCIADVANYARMNDIFSNYRPQIVYHAAAYKHVPMMEANPVEAVVTNVFGSKNVADLSLRYGAEKFVMISTDKAVNPTNIMGASKRIAEIYVQSLALNIKNEHRASTNFITTRFGNVLGSNGSVIPLFRKQIAEGGPITVTHRDIIRYFMTIPEACSLVLEAGCMGKGGEIYIFDMGKPVKIYDLACRMISLSGLRPNVDINIIETGLRPGEKLYEELLNEKELTTATQHKKIMIAKVRTYDYADVCANLAVLHEKVKTQCTHDIVAQMKQIVPEYKSQNSVFENIDKEITEHSITNN